MKVMYLGEDMSYDSANLSGSFSSIQSDSTLQSYSQQEESAVSESVAHTASLTESAASSAAGFSQGVAAPQGNASSVRLPPNSDSEKLKGGFLGFISKAIDFVKSKLGLLDTEKLIESSKSAAESISNISMDSKLNSIPGRLGDMQKTEDCFNRKLDIFSKGLAGMIKEKELELKDVGLTTTDFKELEALRTTKKNIDAIKLTSDKFLGLLNQGISDQENGGKKMDLSVLTKAFKSLSSNAGIFQKNFNVAMGFSSGVSKPTKEKIGEKMKTDVNARIEKGEIKDVNAYKDSASAMASLPSQRAMRYKDELNDLHKDIKKGLGCEDVPIITHWQTQALNFAAKANKA